MTDVNHYTPAAGKCPAALFPRHGTRRVVVVREREVVSAVLAVDNPFARLREPCPFETSPPTCRTAPDFAFFGHHGTVSGG